MRAQLLPHPERYTRLGFEGRIRLSITQSKHSGICVLMLQLVTKAPLENLALGKITPEVVLPL